MTESAIAICRECGTPGRVVFGDDGEIERVLSPCGHMKLPDEPARTDEQPGGPPAPDTRDAA